VDRSLSHSGETFFQMPHYLIMREQCGSQSRNEPLKGAQTEGFVSASLDFGRNGSLGEYKGTPGYVCQTWRRMTMIRSV
jgi:hypothetical protein